MAKNKLSQLRDKLSGNAEAENQAQAPPPYIATPAPASFNRSIPAGDIDEQFDTRTQWFGKDDSEEANIAKLRILNIWEREREDLAQRLMEERARLQTVQRLFREAQKARDVANRLDMLADTAEEVKASELRRHAVLAMKTSHKLETRAHQAEARANALTNLIDGTPRRVHDQAAIVIGHFWVAYDQRAKARSNDVGEWRTEDAQSKAAARKFGKLFGEPEIPTKKTIKKIIAKTRESSDLARSWGLDVEPSRVEETA